MTGQKSELKFPSLLALMTRLQTMIDYFNLAAGDSEDQCDELALSFDAASL